MWAIYTRPAITRIDQIISSVTKYMDAIFNERALPNCQFFAKQRLPVSDNYLKEIPMVIKLILSSLLILLCLAKPCYSASSKLALVIGNSDYAEAPLNNPVNDARDMAQALRGLGFEVIIRENQSQEGMNEAAREFGDRLGEGMVGLFFYAGHGMQVKGKNYLIPVQSGIKREDEVPYRAFDVNQLLAKMESAHNGLNLVVLDACRNNPFERSFRSGEEGLAPMDAPTGTLIAYAAKPGTKSKDSDASGNNGLYTGTLLKYIHTMPQLKIEELLKKVRIDVKKASGEQQATWEEGGLENDFCFAGCEFPPIPPIINPISEKNFEPEMVKLPTGISIGKYEVTQGQWRAVMGINPSHFSNCGDNCPVEMVSWNDTQVFIAKLNSMTGKHFRLPTLEEWFHACFGKEQDDGFNFCGNQGSKMSGWTADDSKSETISETMTHPVGEKEPTNFGLYDMIGNVAEHTSSCNNDGNCAGRMIVGWHFETAPWDFGSYFANRTEWFSPTARVKQVGFRIVLDQAR